MTSQPDEPPFSESHLDSPEYRQRLQRKLNCLIAVLEVASAKVRRSLASPGADVERLVRIQKNLQDTLQVCQRAKRALERRERLPAQLPEVLSDSLDIARTRSPAHARLPEGMVIEMSNGAEFEKFQDMAPIDAREIENVDFEELTRLLQAE